MWKASPFLLIFSLDIPIVLYAMVIPMQKKLGTDSLIADYKTGFIAQEARLQLGAYWGALEDPKPRWGAIISVKEHKTTVPILMTRTELKAAFDAFCIGKQLFDYLVSIKVIDVKLKENYNVDGTQLPRTTFIIGWIVAKPQLLNWAASMAKKGEDHNKFRDFKAGRGTKVHKGIHDLLMGKELKLDKEEEWYINHLVPFLEWQKKVKLAPKSMEITVYNKKVGYAGTADFVGACDIDKLKELMR